MKAWPIVVVFACSGPVEPPAHPMGNVAVDHDAEVHRWREAMVNATVAAMSAGDTGALVALADPGSVFENPADCEHLQRVELEKAATAAKGTQLEVVSMTLARRDVPRRYADREPSAIEPGGKLNGCVAKVRLVVHEAGIRMRVVRDGKPHLKRGQIELVEARGRYFLTKAPIVGDSRDGDWALKKMREYTERMCRCTDKACADQVQEDMTRWGTEAAKSADPDERPDPDMIKESGEIMTRYVDCMTKLMTATPATP